MDTVASFSLTYEKVTYYKTKNGKNQKINSRKIESKSIFSDDFIKNLRFHVVYQVLLITFMTFFLDMTLKL